MSFILEKEGFLRKMILALFVLAMLGPWSFDLLHVPAQYPCDGVTVRLAGDFCGFPVPGFGGVIMVFSGLFRNLGALIKGNAAFLLPELTVLLIMGLVFLPSISTVLLIWKERSRGFKIVNLIFWALGGLAAADVHHAGGQTAGCARPVFGVGRVVLYSRCGGSGHIGGDGVERDYR
jgi:hypothetical protein